MFQVRDRLHGTYRKFKDLPKDQRQQLREELHELRQLSPEEREQRQHEIYREYFPEDR